MAVHYSEMEGRDTQKKLYRETEQETINNSGEVVEKR